MDDEAPGTGVGQWEDERAGAGRAGRAAAGRPDPRGDAGASGAHRAADAGDDQRRPPDDARVSSRLQALPAQVDALGLALAETRLGLDNGLGALHDRLDVLGEELSGVVALLSGAVATPASAGTVPVAGHLAGVLERTEAAAVRAAVTAEALARSVDAAARGSERQRSDGVQAAQEAAEAAERVSASTTRLLEALAVAPPIAGGVAGEAIQAMLADQARVVEALANESARAVDTATATATQISASVEAASEVIAGAAAAISEAASEISSAARSDAQRRADHELAPDLRPALEELATRTAAVHSSVLTGDDATRQALETASAAVNATLDAVVALREQRQREDGHDGQAQGEVSSGIGAAVADLLSDQLGELDHGQGVIEEGLRATWGRLDDLQRAVSALAPEPGAAAGTTAESLPIPWWAAEGGIEEMLTSVRAALGEAARSAAEQVRGLSAQAASDAARAAGQAAAAAAAERVDAWLVDQVAPTETALTLDPDLVDELVRATADAVTDALSARLTEHVANGNGDPAPPALRIAEAAVPMVVEGLMEAWDARLGAAITHAVGPAIEAAVGPATARAVGPAIDAAVGLTLGPAIEEAFEQSVGTVMQGAVGPAIEAVVGSAMASAVGRAVELSVGPAIEAAVGVAMGEPLDAAMEALSSFGPLVARSAADAVDRAIADFAGSQRLMTDPRGAGGSDLTAGMISAFVETVDGVATHVDRRIDALSARIDTLGVVLETVVTAIEDAMATRKGSTREAFVLLRQVAAEAAHGPADRRPTTSRAIRAEGDRRT